MSATDTPPLPPRHVDLLTEDQQRQEESATPTSTSTFCLSPMALLVLLEDIHTKDGHKHIFKSLVAESPAAADTIGNKQIDQEEKLTESVDLDDLQPTPSSTTTRYICQVCHVWLNMSHTIIIDNRKNHCCPGTDCISHHYHQELEEIWSCCGCGYTVSTDFQEPILPMTLFQRLEVTRKKCRSYAEMMSTQGQPQKEPTLVSTLEVALTFINDLLNGVKRNINASNPHFLERFGISDGSQELLEAIGFVLQDNYFIAPPDIEVGSNFEDSIKRIQKELLLVKDVLRKELGNTLVPVSTSELDLKVKPANLQLVLGVNPSLEKRDNINNDYLVKAYTAFGLTSGASDVLVAWAYNKIMHEETSLLDPLDAMDSLMVISNHTNSETLQTLIACERSKGEIARTDIGDAYAYFGVNEDAGVDDGLLIGLYQVKLSDEPLKKNLHQDKLKVIAIARHSTELIDFLKQEKGITSSTNLKYVEDMMGVPASMINIIQHTPVGLNNIGNTCYFNSLLQYYFTIIPFRETMVNSELYVEDDNESNVEDGNSENSEHKKIGGIEVDQSEIRRAKKFVELLKALFINLQYTNEKAISPEYELAYMALLNEKESEDNASTSVVQHQEDTAVPKDKAATATAGIDIQTVLVEEEGEEKEEYGISSTAATTSETTASNMPVVVPPQEQPIVDREMTEAEPTITYMNPSIDIQQEPADYSKSHRLPATTDVESTTTNEHDIQENEERPAIATTTDQLDNKENEEQPTTAVEERPKYTDRQIENAFRRASHSSNFDEIRTDSPPPPYDIGNSTIESLHSEDIKKPIQQENQRPKLKKRPSADNMMLGRQQDVTESMGNVMYLVEAALKPLKKTEDGEQIDDMIRQVFYGKARQILCYRDETTLQTVKKEQEEDFSHVIVDASEGRHLYDGLDECFFANKVENFQGGHEATREVTVKSFPPVLQILVQRVQFDRATANVYKSNAYIQFDRVIYLDRYADDNFEQLKERRAEVADWRAELEKNKKQVAKYAKSNNLKIPIPDLLEATSKILADMKSEIQPAEQAQYEDAFNLLKWEADEKRQIIQQGTEEIAKLKQKIKTQYNDYTDLAYNLHAVFIHQGQANYGHYWIYILDHEENQWWKYNDSMVTKVNESEIYHDTTGSTANPYFLVYVDANKVNQFVETIVKRQEPPVEPTNDMFAPVA